MNLFKSFLRKIIGEPETIFVEVASNLTPRAQQVLALARREADRMNHNFVGTEHLLLGMTALGQGVACNVLKRAGVNLDKLRAEVKAQIGQGVRMNLGNVPYSPPYTPRTKQALMLAAKEAKAFHHTYIGTEHILLGLMLEGDGVAALVLKNLGVNVEQTRKEILRELDPNFGLSDKELESLALASGQEQTLLKHSRAVQQTIVTLDMEGVLTPEIWIAVAEKTKIPKLRRTTRDEPDYDKLMRGRLKILDQHGLKLSDIQQVIGSLTLLDGAKNFLDELRSFVQVIILSDTFEQFAAPLLKQLGQPTLLCHRLVVENDRIVDYKLRVPEQKQRAVAAFKLLNYRVVAAGDSFNDTAMLIEAHTGILFHAPDNVKQQFPQFKAVETYGDLMKLIKEAITA
jgi:phosphoserine / homoserine phosphotransferase